MLHGERPGQDGRPHEIEAASRDEVAITPLGVPLLTGPGAIVTFMVFLAGAPDASFRIALYGAAILVFVITALMLLFPARLDRVLSPSARIVTSRLMGLLLAAIAVEFVAEGALGLVDAWQAAKA